MPEEPEVDTDRLHEAIQEELEREGGSLLRSIALTTAFLAAFAAIASLLAGSTVNEALVLKGESTRLQAQASDQWAYYQAKGIKAVIEESAAAAWEASGRPVPALIEQTRQRYASEQQGIQRNARELERARDAKSEEADHLLHRHHLFAAAVALFQVAIALGAVAALTRIRVVWITSLFTGFAGVVVFVLPYMQR
jgi:hypothetical protein